MTLKRRLDQLEKRNAQHIELQDDPYGLSQMDARTLAQVTKNLLVGMDIGKSDEQRARIRALIDIEDAAEFLAKANADFEFIYNLVTAEDGER